MDNNEKDLQLPNLESVSDSNFSSANEFATQDPTELYKQILSMTKEQRERLFNDLGDSLGIETKKWIEYVNTDLAFFSDYAHILITLENSDLSSHQKNTLIQRIDAIAAKIVGSEKMGNNQIKWIDLETNLETTLDKEQAVKELQQFKEDFLKQLGENQRANLIGKTDMFRAIQGAANGKYWLNTDDDKVTALGMAIEEAQREEHEKQAFQKQLYDRYYSTVFGRNSRVESIDENGSTPAWFDKEGNLREEMQLRSEFTKLNDYYTREIIEKAQLETIETIKIVRSFLSELIEEGLGSLFVCDLQYLPFDYEYKNFAIAYARRIWGDDFCCNLTFLISVIDLHYFTNEYYAFIGRTMESREVELAISNIRNLTNTMTGQKAITDICSPKEVNEMESLSNKQKLRINYFALTLERTHKRKLTFAEILDFLQFIAEKEPQYNPNLEAVQSILRSKGEKVQILIYEKVNSLIERGFGRIELGNTIFFMEAVESLEVIRLLPLCPNIRIDEIYTVLCGLASILNVRFKELAKTNPFITDASAHTPKKHFYVEDVNVLAAAMKVYLNNRNIEITHTQVTHDSIINIFGTSDYCDKVLYVFYAFKGEVNCDNYKDFTDSLLEVGKTHYQL